MPKVRVPTWLRALAAVLSGNVVYFVVLTPLLPTWARHTPFALDAGLLVDLIVCAGIYAGLGLLLRTHHHSS